MLNGLTWRRIDRPLNTLPPIKLLVQLGQHEPQRQRRRNSHSSHDTIMHKSTTVPRRGRVRVQVTRIDGRTVRHRIDEPQRRSPLRRRTREGVADPRQGGGVARVQPGDHEHDGRVSCGDVGGRGGDDEGYDGEPEGDGYVPEALARFVGVPGVDEGCYHAEDVGRAREEEGDDVSVAQGADDGGEEVGHGCGRYVTEEKDELS
jgi:hypothetical protein